MSTQVPEVDQSFLTDHPWVRHYQQGVPARVTIPEHPLTWLLDTAAQLYPDHSVCMYYGTKVTYRQVFYAATHFAIALHQLGVRKGDRVAISLPNIPQYPIAFYGVLMAGAVVVPISPMYTSYEMEAQLVDSGARVLVMLDTFYPLVRASREHTNLQHVIITSASDFLPPVLRALTALSRAKADQPEPHLTHKERHEDHTIHLMHSLLQPRSQDSGIGAALNSCQPTSPSDLAVLQYTGGTTGTPKGAMLTHHNLLANALQARSWFPEARPGEEIMLCAAPFFHAYGMTVCMNVSLLLGASMVLVPRFKPKEVLKTIQRYRPTLFPGIPTMYLALLREGHGTPHMFDSIKFCISGAAPLPAQVQAEFEQLTHGRLVEGYGLTEASPVTHANPLTNECHSGSIGLPFPDIDAVIVDQETGEPVPVGEVGELVVRGPNIMRGYWGRAAETEAVLRDGWLHTGDLGKMDADGYFSIVERIKDVIIASGLKVYPQEVEEVLFQHPTVAEAAVTGIADAYRGETVAAFVVLKPGVEASETTSQELIEYCKHQLAAFKVPHLIEFRESLPKSLIGKVVRRQLRAEQMAHRVDTQPSEERSS